MMAPQETVYLIDDDTDGRLATQVLLELSGWQVMAYASAEDFLADLSRVSPGCLLLDYRMPGMSGLQLFQVMCERDLRWPTIMISGHAEPPLINIAIATGIAAFLLKPVTSADLLQCLRQQFAQMRSVLT